jgi:hypothetical protein
MQAPVMVIDDFHPDPHALVAQAAAGNFSVTAKYYPGVRAKGSFEYVKGVRQCLRALLPEVFGAPHGLEPTECNFSMVTLPPEQTIPFQRIPHFDGTDGNTFAVLHYLCQPRHGGTAFYRHRRTGIEVVTPANVEHYARAVDADMAEHGLPAPGYVTGSTALFEQIAAYEAVFNRALVYSGTSLHSGLIPEGWKPDANPTTGRLTVNTFLQLHPAR